MSVLASFCPSLVAAGLAFWFGPAAGPPAASGEARKGTDSAVAIDWGAMFSGLKQPGRPEGDPRAQKREQIKKEKEQLKEKMRDLQRRLEQVPGGPQPERQELERSINDIHLRLLKIEEELRALDGGPEPGRTGPEQPGERARQLMDERRQLEEKAQNIIREIDNLKRFREEEIRKLQSILGEVKDKAQRLEREAGRMQGPGPGPGRSGGPPPDEMNGRQQHFKVAIDNLHAAGLHELAEKLAREGKRLLHEGGQPSRPGSGVEPPSGPSPPGEPSRSGPPPGAMGPPDDIQRIRSELQELRNQVNELRIMLTESLERQRR
jgi:hypothetical protein